MAKKPTHKRRRAVILTVAALAVCALAAWLWIYGPGKAKRYAMRLVTEAVHSQLGDPYRLTLGEMHIKLWDGQVSFESVRIEPDSALLDSLEKIGRRPAAICRISSGRMQVAIKLPRDKHLEIKHINISSPKVEIERNPKFYPNSLAQAREKSVMFRLPFDSVVVRSVNVDNGMLRLSDIRGGDTVRHRFDKISLRIEKVAFDSTLRIKDFRLPEVDDLHFRVAASAHSPVGKGYDMDIKRISYLLRGGVLEADSLSLTPRYGKHEFVQKTGTDWTRFFAGKIILSGIDPHRLIEGGGLKADSAELFGLQVESYKNRQAAMPEKIKPLFHQMIQRIAIPVDIPMVRIAGGSARYEELPVKGDAPGVIYFKDITARVDSLTNIPGRNDYITISASAEVMGQGHMKADISLPVDSLDNHFMIKGTLGAVPFEAFNPMIEPLARIKAGEGKISKLAFNIEGNDRAGVIDMRMEYDGLKVEVLDKMGARSWFGSALVNTLVVTASNPLPGKEVRAVHTTAVRDPYRSNFNYWWRLLFEGVKQSIGLTPQKQQELTSLQNEFHAMKLRREERKRQRQLK